MAIVDQLQDDVKTAMKARETEKVQALRLIVAELQRASKDGNDDELAILRTARKKRVEAAKAFRDGGRDDAAEQEESEAALIDQYLPAQMDDTALDAAVASTIEQVGATGMSDMGKVMGAVMGKVNGEADGNRVQASVKAHLSGEKNAG
ncbi:MAG: GatB/YqeY domain-containing protein [Solirubrobacterales bacterium]|nr:GatB/YqeY domain-containing protein [Solirubrobacterales bacterium]